jgi:hypothetical protein
MTRYFRLRDDMSIPGRWVLGAPLDALGKEMDPWQFERGHALEPGFPPRFPLLVPGQPLDFSGAAFGILVVHKRFVQLFERHGWQQEVQFIPAHVDEQPEPYFILNTLRTIKCIDERRSGEIDYWRPEHGEPGRIGMYRAVHGLKVDPTRVEGANIFRTWGWNVALIVSEDLKRALEGNHVTGVKFVEV